MNIRVGDGSVVGIPQFLISKVAADVDSSHSDVGITGNWNTIKRIRINVTIVLNFKPGRTVCFGSITLNDCCDSRFQSSEDDFGFPPQD